MDTFHLLSVPSENLSSGENIVKRAGELRETAHDKSGLVLGDDARKSVC